MYRKKTRAICPDCKHTEHQTISTQLCEGEIRLRRKKCLSCGCKFYTAQQPEFTLKTSQVVWIPSEGTNSRKTVAQLRWLPAPCAKQKALAVLESAEGADYPTPITTLTAEQHALIREALEQLPDAQ